MIRALLIVFFMLSLAASGQGHPSSAPFAQIPFILEPNRGQADSRADLIGYGGGYRAEISSNRISLTGRKGRSLVLGLAGSQAEGQFVAVETLPGVANYYSGKTASTWLENLPMYGRVRYAQLYPGIDVEFHNAGANLEYDFVVGPGADPRLIRIDLKGSKQVRLQGEELLVGEGPDTFRLRRPVAYQVIDGKQKRIDVSFELKRQRLTFRVGAYEKQFPLVIDPVIAYGTYLSLNGEYSEELGGIAVDSSGSLHMVSTSQGVQVVKLSPTGNGIQYFTHLGVYGDSGAAIALDPAGNAYVVGAASHPAFPITPNAYITTCSFAGSNDSCLVPFAAKLSPTGTLVYSTFLGGSNAGARAVAVDGNGVAHIAGVAAYTDFPVINAFQSQYGGGISTSSTNGFVVKLAADGKSASYSTYFGIDGEVRPSAIAVDSTGAFYLGGTGGTTPLYKAYSKRGRGFLAKFTADGSHLVYATRIGGSLSMGNFSDEELTAIAVDSAGNLVAVGSTGTSDFPVTENALKASLRCQPGPYSCGRDAFLLKLNATGDTLLFSTYLGGSGSDSGFGVAIDPAGNMLVSGTTSSPDLPTLNPVQDGLQQAPASCCADAFVASFSPSGVLLFSSYLGGALANETLARIATDTSGNVYIAGTTAPSGGSEIADFPAVNALQPTLDCCPFNKVFATKINMASSAPLLSVSPDHPPLTYLRNVGNSSITVFSTSSPSTCQGTLGPGGSCVAGLTPDGDYFTYSTSAGSGAFGTAASDQNFSGAWILDISAKNLFFPPQQIGTPSETKQVKITNLSKVNVTIPTLVASNSTLQITSNSCNNQVLAPRASCTLSAYVIPNTGFFNNNGGVIYFAIEPASFFIYASTLAMTNAMDASPVLLDFDEQFLGAQPRERVLSIFNDSNTTITPTNFVVTGDFVPGNSCAVSIAPHGECRLKVAFVPSQVGKKTGTLRFDFPGSSKTIELKGTGRQLTDLDLNPFELQFGLKYIGSSWTTLDGGTVEFPGNPPPVKVLNPTSSPLSITSVLSSGEFTQTNDCPSVLAAGQICTIYVTFSPLTVGAKTGTLSVGHSGQGSPAIAALTGTGTSQLNFPVDPAVFASQVVGRVGPLKYVGISNTQSIPIALQASVTSPDFVLVESQCPPVLTAYAGCDFLVAFKPQQAGIRTGQISFTTDLNEPSRFLTLTGTGLDFSLNLGRPARPTRSGSGASQTIQAGETARYQVELKASDGFASPIHLECRAAANIQCDVPDSIQPVAGANTFDVTIKTSARKAARLRSRQNTGTPAGSYAIEVVATIEGASRSLSLPALRVR